MTAVRTTRFFFVCLLVGSLLWPVSTSQAGRPTTSGGRDTPSPPNRDSAQLEADPQATFSGVARVVAIGDVHGDFGAFLEVLRLAGLIDVKGHWVGGRTHLVQTGDVPDRGDNTRAVFDLLMRLEVEARRAGGQVHALLGNHEVMNMRGDLRYTTPADLASYADQSPLPDPAGIPRGTRGHKIAFSSEGRYGRWLRGHPAVVRIDQTLYVHGGVAPGLSARNLNQLNRWVRQDLFAGLTPGGGIDPQGPLWFRGYAIDPESRWADGLDQVLAKYGANRMVMGHTTTRGDIRQRFKGKAIFIDTGLSAHYGRHLAALEVRDRQLTALYPDKKVRLLPPQSATPPIQ